MIVHFNCSYHCSVLMLSDSVYSMVLLSRSNDVVTWGLKLLAHTKIASVIGAPRLDIANFFGTRGPNNASSMGP